MEQGVQLGGAVLILIAYVASQLNVLRPTAVSYLVLK